MNYIDEVHKVVKRIPEGKVSTYGDIAELAGVSPRMVGRALHQNTDPQSVPCHRIVNRNGRVAESYAFGGAEEQKRRLLAEGVRFRDKTHVESAYFYRG